MNDFYEAVIGLEVHAELKTDTKIFCTCSTRFGAAPNTQCCPVCMGHPGVLPSLNRHAVELALRAGLALNCKIARHSRMDRKHYFYPDLPKAYQISQNEFPLCEKGFLEFFTGENTRRIGITRIHLEEDAGKLTHTDQGTLIDFNRCGVPLIEIVSSPEIRSGEEAADYLRALRAILVRCGVSDCKMQEGSLRCDVNISLRPAGSNVLGVRSEIKNLNSFAYVQKAIQYEIARQSEMLRRGETLYPETRRYDETLGITVLMRRKESTVDYRILPEPDIPPFSISEEEIERTREELPELPAHQIARVVEEYGIAVGDAEILVTDPGLAQYYEEVATLTAYPKTVANLLLTDLLPHCESDPFFSPVSGTAFAELATLAGQRRINSSTTKRLLLRMTREELSPAETAEREGLWQITDPDALRETVDQVLSSNPRAVADWQGGKRAALQALQGQVMKKTQGRADPVLSETLLLSALNAKNREEEI